MIDVPRIQYAQNREGHYLAYQVVGRGPLDLVFVPDWNSNLDLVWDSPAQVGAVERLVRFSRVVWFDKRGTGLSDPLPSAGADAPAMLEAWMDDVVTVMDAAGSRRAALLSTGFGGMMAALFAATHPDRTSHLVLMNAFVRPARAPDFRPGMPPSVQELVLRQIADRWGRGAFRELLGSDSPEAWQWFQRYQRGSISPGVAVALCRSFFESDVRAALPVIETPTLVLHRAGDLWARVDHGRHLAEAIPGARYVELEGEAHAFTGARDPALAEIEEFLTGERAEVDGARVLATVLFVDVVGSTERAVALGDRAWSELLERYHAVARSAVARFRGREIDSAGDGFFAAFDRPARAIRCARELRDDAGALGLEIRAGLHTGECQELGQKLSGIAVHVGARVAERAAAGEVLVSGTVKDLVAGSGLSFADRGLHHLKGLDEKRRLYALR